MALPIISIFTGAGGLDEGLRLAGFDIRIAQDNDEASVNTLRANNVLVAAGDIRQLLVDYPDASFLLRNARLARGEAFAVVGGPPCQSFSTAGNRRGLEDARGMLIHSFVDVVAAIQPHFFVLENVKGLTSIADGTVLSGVLDRFTALGYQTIHGVVDAVWYGVPQFRERLVIIGSRGTEELFLPHPTHFQTHQLEHYRWRTLGQSIMHLEANPGPYVQFSDAQQEALWYVPSGGNWHDLPEHVQQKAMGNSLKSGGGKTGFYRRLSYAQPSPTLVTSPIQRATMLCHPIAHRPLSVTEYARIQEFHPEYHFSGTLKEQYRQIGNAVPVGLGYAIGETLRAIASQRGTVRTKRVRGTPVYRDIVSPIEDE